MSAWNEGQRAAYRLACRNREPMGGAEYARIDALCRKLIGDNPTYYRNWWAALSAEDRAAYLR